MLARPKPQTRPTVYVAEADYERLANLAETHDTSGGDLLAGELERAVVVGAEDGPPTFARLHSFVTFRDQLSGRMRRVQLVPPEEADIDQGRVSVVTPVGAALVGLTPGDEIDLSTDDGRPQRLAVVKVDGPEEAA